MSNNWMTGDDGLYEDVFGEVEPVGPGYVDDFDFEPGQIDDFEMPQLPPFNPQLVRADANFDGTSPLIE